MRKRAYRRSFRGGMSLVEVVIALLVFAIMVLGAAYYRYVTVLDIEQARSKLAAADLAVTLIETWQGAGGASSFNPVTTLGAGLKLTVAEDASAPTGYSLLGAYDVTISDRTYASRLYWKDVAADLRELGAAISWSSNAAESGQIYQLTTYVRR